MNAEIRLADRVLVLGSPGYRSKVHAYEEGHGVGGVGWESMLLTAHIFAGHREKVVVAVARGDRADALHDFLQTHPIHDLSNPEDSLGYRELLAELQGERPSPPPVGTPRAVLPPEVTPLFQEPPLLENAMELRSWVDARWPEGHPDAIYPPWSEFEAEVVRFPARLIDSVEASLKTSSRALIVGRSASGKSVLAAVVAYRWSRATGRRAFWIDLGDELTESAVETRRDIKTLQTLGGSNLLVIDNAQVDPALADWAVTRVGRGDVVGDGQLRLLILTRPVQGRVHHRAGLEERLDEPGGSFDTPIALS